jgi:hypothetical protein
MEQEMAAFVSDNSSAQSHTHIDVNGTESCQTCGTILRKEDRETMSHLTPAVEERLRDICAKNLGQDWAVRRSSVKIEQIQ